MKNLIRFSFLVVFLSWHQSASAQCSGVFPANSFCGTTTSGPPSAKSLSVIAGNQIDVFLIAGQSNAVGQGITPADSPTVTSGQVLQVNGGTISNANDPVGSGAHQATSTSAWPAFGITYNNATKRKIAFVPMASDGTTQVAACDVALNGNWSATGTLYSAAVAAADAALTTLSSAGYTPVFRGVLWVQGETDAANLGSVAGCTQTDYISNLQAMLIRFRTHYGATMPFYMSRIGTDTAVSDASYAQIRQAQEYVVSIDPYSIIMYRNAINFQSAGWDRGVHYQTAGYNDLGYQGAVAAINFLKGMWTQNTNLNSLNGAIWASSFVGIGNAQPRGILDILAFDTIANTSGDAIAGAVIQGPGVPPSTSATALLTLQSNDASAIDKGAGIVFGGQSLIGNTAAANFSAIYGAKENATDNNFAGYVGLYTRAAGGALTKKVNVSSAGSVTFGSYAGGMLRTNSSGVITSLAGTSGGIPYFDSSNIPQSSSLLGASQIVVGGGAGTQPGTIGSTGTTTTVLHGNASGNPSFGQVANADLVNSSTTVNTQTCTLGSSCTVTAVPSGSAGGDLTGTYPNPTLAAIISAGGPIGSATVSPIITYDAKGRLTAVSSATITPAVGSITGLGTGVATALGTNIGTAGSFVVNGGALGSPSSAGTIPAFTLGGTVSGGGNQINNVIIGTSTPLAGFFTTASATTSVTTPVHIGGSASGSSAEIRSTSGTGSGDLVKITGGTNGATRAATFLGAGLTGFGSAAGAATPTNTTVAISNNVTAVDAALSGQSTLLHVVGADSTSPAVLIDSFGNSQTIMMRRANGTAASKTAVTSGQVISVGNDGRAWDSAAYGSASAMLTFAAENWDASHHGAYVDFYMTPLASTTLTQGVRFQASGGVSIGATTDPGTGGLLASGATIRFTALANTATTSAVCYNTATGLLTYNSTVGTCTVSDGRLKTERGPIVGALDKILQVRGLYYDWKDPATYGQGRQIGVIAQDVEKVFPELVSIDSTGRMSADYQKLVAPIIEALRELKADNDNMKQEMAQLKNRIK